MSMSIDHPVTLVPQSGKMGCWSASISMLLGSRMTPGPGDADTGPDGGMKPDVGNMQTLARAYGLTLHPPHMSWAEWSLQELVFRGPIMVCGRVPNGHCFVISGVSGGNLHVLDPWPVGVGNDLWISYEQLMNRYPMATLYILQRPW